MEPVERIKNKARALHKYLMAQGLELPYSKSLEAMAAVEGLADWNTYAADLETARHERFCPSCGSHASLQVLANVWVEQGAFNGREYEFEGDATSYACAVCGVQLVDWQVDATELSLGRCVVIHVKRRGQGYLAQAIELRYLAMADDNDSVTLAAEIRSGERDVDDLIEMTRLFSDYPGPVATAVGATEDKARRKLDEALSNFICKKL